MPGILNRRLFAPLHLDGGEHVAPLDDVVHFRPVLGAQVIQLAPAEVLEPLPQFEPHSLLEKPARIHLHHIGCRRQSPRRVAHAQVEGSARATISVSGGNSARRSVDFPVCRAPKTRWTYGLASFSCNVPAYQRSNIRYF